MLRYVVVIAFLLTNTSGSARRIGVNHAGRIFNGSEAPDDQYPYQISFRIWGTHMCGGSIIANEWIVTAAHCLMETTPEILSVYVGSNKLSSGGTLHAVLETHYHELYDPGFTRHDVAIIKVEPITYTDKVRPIVLDAEYVSDGESCTLSGWGPTNLRPPELPDKLQHLSVLTMTREVCESKLNLPVHEEEICTTSEVGQGACSLDGGGPLVKTVNGVVKQIGVISWYLSCGFGYPDIHSRTSFYIDWFKEKCGNCF